MGFDIANASAVELRELEAQVTYAEFREVTGTATSTVERVRAAITAVESRRQHAQTERAAIFDAGLNQALAGETITTDLTQVAALDAAAALYARSTAHLLSFDLQDALVAQAEAALREAEGLYSYECARRAAQEERILEGAAKIPTGGVPFVLDTALLLESWTRNIVRAENIRDDAQRNLRNALAERQTKRAAYVEKYGVGA